MDRTPFGVAGFNSVTSPDKLSGQALHAGLRQSPFQTGSIFGGSPIPQLVPKPGLDSFLDRGHASGRSGNPFDGAFQWTGSMGSRFTVAVSADVGPPIGSIAFGSDELKLK